MLNEISREELNLMMESVSKKAAKCALAEFMDEYKLEAAHFVWITRKFDQEMSARKTVSRAIIIFFVGLVGALLGLGAETKIKSWFVPNPPAIIKEDSSPKNGH